MTTFCCFAAGENFPGDLIGVIGPIGFFVSVFVNAPSQQEAERMAREVLDAHPELTLPGGAKLPEVASVIFKVVHELEHVVKPTVTEFQFFEKDQE